MMPILRDIEPEVIAGQNGHATAKHTVSYDLALRRTRSQNTYIGAGLDDIAGPVTPIRSVIRCGVDQFDHRGGRFSTAIHSIAL